MPALEQDFRGYELWHLFIIGSSASVCTRAIKRTTKQEQHFAPGTIVNLQVDTSHPIGAGVASDTYGYYINSPFFQSMEGFASQKVAVVARYPNVDVNASGWLRGEDLMVGRGAVVTIETNRGKVVLFGIRPQHRGQTHATFPLLFNALYWAAEGRYSITPDLFLSPENCRSRKPHPLKRLRTLRVDERRELSFS